MGTRITGRLGWTHPEIAGFLADAGLGVLDIPVGLARALRDIEAGQAAGRFTVPDAEIALRTATGGMLGLFRMRQRYPERVRASVVLPKMILQVPGLAGYRGGMGPPS